jgi:hypothetical protein
MSTYAYPSFNPRGPERPVLLKIQKRLKELKGEADGA